ncbi:MAG: class I SAM-dependent methyltransferase [Rubrobacter sp.]|nr:class I SAM-dependent methyltransferase [Rubrobacter sp.]
MKARTLLWTMIKILGGLLLHFFVGLKVQSRLAATLNKPRACPAAYAWVLERPRRIRQEVPHVFNRIGMRPGERVLEVGCGPGIYTVQAASRLQPNGQLVAVDLQREMVERASERIRQAGLDDVEFHISDAHQLPLEDSSVDRAFLVGVLPEIQILNEHSPSYGGCYAQMALSQFLRGFLIRIIDSPSKPFCRYSRRDLYC